MNAKGIAVVALILGLVWYVNAGKKAPERAAHSRNEVEVTPAVEAELRGAIEAADYVCPRIKLVFAEGVHPEGDRFRVHCGPPDRAGIYERLAYDLVITPGNRVRVAPAE